MPVFTRGLRFAASFTLGLLVACNGEPDQPSPASPGLIDGAGSGAGAPPTTAMVAETASPPGYPAFPMTPAQLVTRGGKILKAPKLVLLTYAGDPLAAVATEFVSMIGNSSYWSGATKEYGVGPATALSAVTLSDRAPATIDQTGIETWLAGELDGSHAEVPAPDGETVYVIVYPASTTITRGAELGCQDFGGFHAEAAAGASGAVPYVALPRCSTFAGLSGNDLLTYTMSHEIVEAMLDPFTESGPAYSDVDKLHETLAIALGGGEAGDICPEDATHVPDMPFLVQRTWSNASAKTGHQPCVPRDPLPYFFANPMLPDLSTDGVPVVKVEVGKNRSIDLQLSSDAPMGADWTVTLIDVATLRKKPAELSFTLDRTTGNNGDVLHATISSLRGGTVGTKGGYSLFLVRSVSKDERVSLLAGGVQN